MTTYSGALMRTTNLGAYYSVFFVVERGVFLPEISVQQSILFIVHLTLFAAKLVSCIKGSNFEFNKVKMITLSVARYGQN